jgi:hypothetical protein
VQYWYVLAGYVLTSSSTPHLEWARTQMRNSVVRNRRHRKLLSRDQELLATAQSWGLVINITCVA